MKNVLKNILLVIFVLVSTVIILEVLTQFFENKRVVEPTPSQYDFYRFDPKLGWANEPKSEGTYKRREFEYAIKINSYGMRYREFSKEKNSDAYRVAALGDSFTWGIGVADSERFTEKVEAATGNKIEMLNFGVSGYGPIQYYLLLDEIIKHKPDMVLIAFCLGNDFADNVLWNRYGYYKPYAEMNTNDELEIHGYPLPNRGGFGFGYAGGNELLAWIEKNSAIARRVLLLKKVSKTSGANEQKGLVKFAEGDIYVENADNTETVNKAVAINELLLGEIKERLGKAGIKLAVMEVPTKFEVGLEGDKKKNLKSHKALMTTLGKLNIDRIELIDDITPEDFWIHDGHWKPSGHEKATGRIYEFLTVKKIIR